MISIKRILRFLRFPSFSDVESQICFNDTMSTSMPCLIAVMKKYDRSNVNLYCIGAGFLHVPDILALSASDLALAPPEDKIGNSSSFPENFNYFFQSIWRELGTRTTLMTPGMCL